MKVQMDVQFGHPDEVGVGEALDDTVALTVVDHVALDDAVTLAVVDHEALDDAATLAVGVVVALDEEVVVTDDACVAEADTETDGDCDVEAHGTEQASALQLHDCGQPVMLHLLVHADPTTFSSRSARARRPPTSGDPAHE